MTSQPAIRHLDRASLILLLLMPVFLLHAHAGAEVIIAIVSICFLVRSAIARDWAWARTPWLLAGWAWWGWLVFCSLPGIGQVSGSGGWHSLFQAVATVRFIVFLAALEHAVLRPPGARRWMGGVITLSTLYVGVQALFQFATGHNFYGHGRGADGELTGPFGKPRAGAMYSRLLFPAMLPPVAALLARRRLWASSLAVGIALLGVGLQVLIGQRMPLLLTGLGLVVSGLLLPRLRLPVGAAIVAVVVLIPATAVISPPAFHRLVTEFSRQMEGFQDSHYGLIAARAIAIAEAHPWTGRGYDGFRTGCAEPRYFHGWHGPADQGGGATICVQHPHNHWLQAVTDAGIPGLILFSLLVWMWLATLFTGLWRDPDPLRVGLFVAALLQEWPIASASAFTSMPLSGWFFLLLGWGLAETRWRGAMNEPASYIASRNTPT